MRWKQGTSTDITDIVDLGTPIETAQVQQTEGESSNEETAVATASTTNTLPDNANGTTAVGSERLTGLQKRVSGDTDTPTVTDDIKLQPSGKVADGCSSDGKNKSLTDIQTSPDTFGQVPSGVTKVTGELKDTHAEELRKARLQKARSAESTNDSNHAGGLSDSAKELPSIASNVRKRAHSPAPETDLSAKRVKVVQKESEENASLPKNSSVSSKASSVTPAGIAHGVGLLSASAVTKKVLAEGPDVEIIDLLSESENDTEENNLKTLGRYAPHTQPSREDGDRVEKKIDIIDLCSESEDGSMDGPEETSNGHGNLELQTGRQNDKTNLQAALNQGAKSSQSTSQTASSLIPPANTSSGDQPGQLQPRAPSAGAPSSTPALAGLSPETKEDEQQTHTYVAPQRPTGSSKQRVPATSNRSEESQTHPFSAPQLATPASMQVAPPQRDHTIGLSTHARATSQQSDPASRNEHSTSGSQTNDHGSHTLGVPQQSTPATVQVNQMQGNKATGLPPKPVGPGVGDPKREKANRGTGSHSRQPTNTPSQQPAAAPVATNVARAPRATTSQAVQGGNPHKYGSGPRHPYNVNGYYHDNTRDQRYFANTRPTEEQRSTCWGHDPKGTLNFLFNVSV